MMDFILCFTDIYIIYMDNFQLAKGIKGDKAKPNSEEVVAIFQV